MTMTIIAAVAQNGVIGDSETGKMVWNVPSEMAFFRRMTSGKTVVMGRKTAESVGPLKMRRNVVLTRGGQSYAPDGFRAETLRRVLSSGGRINSMLDGDNSEVMICGGRQVYDLLMPHCDKLLISRMPFEGEGDVLFPEIDLDIWRIDLRTKFEEFTVERYIRRS